MNILKSIFGIIDMIVFYFKRKSGEQKEEDLQKFSDDVVKGNEDKVSEQISDLIKRNEWNE